MAIEGFSGGIPRDVDEEWTKEKNGRTFTFGKTRKSATHFVYYCQRSVGYATGTEDLSTGFELDRDLTHKETESWPQFVAFMEM